MSAQGCVCVSGGVSAREGCVSVSEGGVQGVYTPPDPETEPPRELNDRPV